ncbi:hypothetical protein SELMODRAFT_415414 [Selaginella moellendorffii]|uniref:Reverse transcriptase zinc-binding domain-containing protein n=1 Tax=Selaginella moellendorffii TaxID=88036 RepID=D8RW21_SELML|nr:hypothetical protein SELMODRAFT_415414 [Selaginella moellendorffii]
MCKDFFQYETKLGRKLIKVLTRSSLIRKAKAQQIHSRNHSYCINKIWKGRWSAKNRYFMWLAQQERLPSLAAIYLPNTAYKTCGTIETQQHILWECPAAQELWEGAAVGCTLAKIWKARCARLFDDTDPSAQATISKVWYGLIVSLMARLDTLIKQGKEGKIAKEKKLWPFFRGRSGAGEEEWTWKPPIWIWQHMFRNDSTCTSPSRQSSTPGTSEAWRLDVTDSITNSTLSPLSHPP